MASIREIRKNLMPVLVGLLLLDVACAGYLLSPLGRSRRARLREYAELKTQLAATRKDVEPTRGMDGKLKQANTDIGTFYQDRFPAEYSSITAELGKLASENGVQIASVKYDDKEAPVDNLRRLSMELALSGSYLQEVKFINALERDQMFFLIDGVALGEQQGQVRLQLKVETYLRQKEGVS